MQTLHTSTHTHTERKQKHSLAPPIKFDIFSLTNLGNPVKENKMWVVGSFCCELKNALVNLKPSEFPEGVPAQGPEPHIMQIAFCCIKWIFNILWARFSIPLEENLSSDKDHFLKMPYFRYKSILLIWHLFCDFRFSSPR